MTGLFTSVHSLLLNEVVYRVMFSPATWILGYFAACVIVSRIVFKPGKDLSYD